MSLSESFARTGFAKFINTTAGRIVRIVAGLALIIWGISIGLNTTGIIFIIVGLVPFIAGTFNLCIISGLLGGPLRLVKNKLNDE